MPDSKNARFRATRSEDFGERLLTFEQPGNLLGSATRATKSSGSMSDSFRSSQATPEKSVYLSDGTHDALGAHDVYFNQMARASPYPFDGEVWQ